MKIIIETTDTNFVKSVKGTGTDIGAQMTTIDIQKNHPSEDIRLEGIVGVLMGFFLSYAEKFCETHPCKDCPVYLLYSQAYQKVKAIEREVFDKALGEAELFDFLESKRSSIFKKEEHDHNE